MPAPSEQVGVRSIREVAERVAALAIVNARSGLEPRDKTAAMVAPLEASSILSPAEWAFYQAEPAEYPSRVLFSWGIEGASVLLWALGHKGKKLPAARKMCDSAWIRDLVSSNHIDGLARGAQPVSQAVLETTLEGIYQTHWALRDAELNGTKVPKGIKVPIVEEQHRALNWLTDDSQDWDDVTTDT
jgi:hypothetical protein